MDTANLRPLSPPSKLQALPPTKVCIICSCAYGQNDEYNIYIVDLNSGGNIVNAADEVTPRPPTLRLDRESFEVEAFCVLHSTLYMFEGNYDRDTNPHGGKKVYTFELSSDVSTNFDLKLEKGMLREAPDMLHAKDSVVAVPTPDGEKILVFSYLITFGSSDHTDDIIDFELYDPANRTWHKLPGICDDWGDGKGYIVFRIKAHAFISKSVFLVQTEIGMFALDLESTDIKGWEQLDSFRGARSIPDVGSFLVVGDDLCLNPYCSDGFPGCFYRPPSSSVYDYGVSECSRAMTLLDVVYNVECSFCITETGLNLDIKYPRLTVDVYRCDVIKYREEEEDKEKMGDSVLRIVKSFKFLLNAQQYRRFSALDMYSIRAGTN